MSGCPSCPASGKPAWPCERCEAERAALEGPPTDAELAFWDGVVRADGYLDIADDLRLIGEVRRLREALRAVLDVRGEDFADPVAEDPAARSSFVICAMRDHARAALFPKPAEAT